MVSRGGIVFFCLHPGPYVSRREAQQTHTTRTPHIKIERGNEKQYKRRSEEEKEEEVEEQLGEVARQRM